MGRQAPLSAALLAAATANLALALLTFCWLPVTRLPLAGSAALAPSISGCGLVFAGVAAVGAQFAMTGRGARGSAIAALGAAFVLRAVGDRVPELSGVLACPGLGGAHPRVRSAGGDGGC